MAENGSCKDCRAHSGIAKDILHLQKESDSQQEEINSMKRWLIATLTTSILSLLGILTSIAIAYIRIVG